MVRADCRKCRYFVPKSVIDSNPNWHLEEPWIGMPKEEFEDMIEEMLIKEAKGHKALGLCRKRRKPVYYYEGRCRYFSPKPPKYRQLTLADLGIIKG